MIFSSKITIKLLKKFLEFLSVGAIDLSNPYFLQIPSCFWIEVLSELHSFPFGYLLLFSNTTLIFGRIVSRILLSAWTNLIIILITFFISCYRWILLLSLSRIGGTNYISRLIVFHDNHEEIIKKR